MIENYKEQSSKIIEKLLRSEVFKPFGLDLLTSEALCPAAGNAHAKVDAPTTLMKLRLFILITLFIKRLTQRCDAN